MNSHFPLILELDDRKFVETAVPKNFELRKAVRGIIQNKKNQFAVLYSTKDNYHKSPGGGSEKDENYEQTLLREIKEEIGFDVEIIDQVGLTIEYINSWSRIHLHYYFWAETTGHEKELTHTEKEKNDGLIVQWYDLETLIQKYQSDLPSGLKRNIIKERELAVLEYFKAVYKK